jgi:hypothetical protein
MSGKNSTSHLPRSGTSAKSNLKGAAKTYRLLRTVGGKTAFAEVTVRMCPGSVNVVHCSEKIAQTASVLAPPRAWLNAAVRGARSTLAYLSKHRLVEGAWEVWVEQVVGSVSDTTPESVTRAAVTAVWTGLLEGCAAPEIVSLKPLRIKRPLGFALLDT